MPQTPNATTPPIFQYRFNRFEPALFVEIYLPKKIRYQGALYDSLRTGFNIDEVRKHLKTKAYFAKIAEFLEDYEEIYKIYRHALDNDNNLSDLEARVDKMQHTFCGYSMYEVDGVFFDKKKYDNRAGTKETINKYIAEETVQVVRMMFMPDIKAIFDEVGIHTKKNLSESDLRQFLYMRDFFKQSLERQYVLGYELKQQEERINDDEMVRKILKDKIIIHDRIATWIDDVALFIFGFIIYNICQKITDLQKEQEKPEDEIWVTSLGNLEINRIVLRE